MCLWACLWLMKDLINSENSPAQTCDAHDIPTMLLVDLLSARVSRMRLSFSRTIMISSKRRVVPLIQMLFSSVHLVCSSLSCRLCVADSLVFVPQIRDDNKRQHPCLVDFSKLPETERNYNLQMSTETLK